MLGAQDPEGETALKRPHSQSNSNCFESSRWQILQQTNSASHDYPCLLHKELFGSITHRQHRKQQSPLLRGPSASPFPARLTQSFPLKLCNSRKRIFSKQRDLRQKQSGARGTLVFIRSQYHISIGTLGCPLLFMEQNLAKPKGLVICSASTCQLLNLGAKNKSFRQTSGPALRNTELSVVH